MESDRGEGHSSDGILALSADLQLSVPLKKEDATLPVDLSRGRSPQPKAVLELGTGIAPSFLSDAPPPNRGLDPDAWLEG